MKVTRRWLLSATTASLCLVSGCAEKVLQDETRPTGFTLQSPVLAKEKRDDLLPYSYTKQGENVSPPLWLSDIPDFADYFALTLRDVTGADEIPLWLLWGTMPNEGQIPEAISKRDTPPELSNTTQGTNSRGTVGYAGPDLTREYDSRDGNTSESSVEITAYALGSSIELVSDNSHSDLIDAINEQFHTSTSLYAKIQRETLNK